MTLYDRRRRDGWPLCPRCGDDELWSAGIPATVDTIVSCLRCGWRPHVIHAPHNERTTRCGLPLKGKHFAGNPALVTCPPCAAALGRQGVAA